MDEGIEAVRLKQSNDERNQRTWCFVIERDAVDQGWEEYDELHGKEASSRSVRSPRIMVDEGIEAADLKQSNDGRK